MLLAQFAGAEALPVRLITCAVMSWYFADDSPLRALSSRTLPKIVFNAVCDELGRYFAPDGLRYVRSRPRVEQRCGDLVLTLSMWSSRSNVGGEHVALEVVSHVDSRALAKWVKATGIGGGKALFTVDTRNARTGRYEKYFNVAAVTPASFVDLAETIRRVCWEPMTCITAEGTLRAEVHPRLEPIEDNFACWLWMRGRRDEALATAGLSDDVRARLLAQA
ncbi:hypothetical protein [Actinoallomurus sp. NPDC052274]|uniref:hypothetical protein n=1 Tax=Actinoallomurus sp. NPDC052274 TaxID=3155420 RepID=UPI00343DAE5E